MKFNENRKEEIKLYILQKIAMKSTSISKSASEAFEINPSTIHSYLNELINDGIIKKVKRDTYELVTENYTFDLSRSRGELKNDSAVFNMCLRNQISHLGKNVQGIWSYAFSEMINNAMEHSEAENVKVIVSQNYISTKAIIIDNGVGIFNKIKNYFKLDTLDDAICELFKGKLTTDKENHSGEGIFFSSRLMDYFEIISDGKKFANNKYNESIVLDLQIENQKGTCVNMELSNFSHRRAKDVFDEYSSIDEGFVKTGLPLKNIFDASPVSRSQAKQLCARLDNFKEVILDFNEIEWMGQGFAHQIFVVFAKQNPDIKISAVNMNEDVEKMYRHVILTKYSD